MPNLSDAELLAAEIVQEAQDAADENGCHFDDVLWDALDTRFEDIDDADLYSDVRDILIIAHPKAFPGCDKDN